MDDPSRKVLLDLSTDEQRSVGFTIDAVELADGEA